MSVQAKSMLRDFTARAARTAPSKVPDRPVEMKMPSTSSPALADASNSSSKRVRREGWLDVGMSSTMS